MERRRTRTTQITARIANTPPTPTPTPTPTRTFLPCEAFGEAAAEADAATADTDELEMAAAGEGGGNSGADVIVTVSVSVSVLAAGNTDVGVEAGGNRSKSILIVSPKPGFCTQAVFSASASGFLGQHICPISPDILKLTITQRLRIRHLIQTSGAIVESIIDALPITVKILQCRIGLQEPIGQGFFGAVVRARAHLGALLVRRYGGGVIRVSKYTIIQIEFHIDYQAPSSVHSRDI